MLSSSIDRPNRFRLPALATAAGFAALLSACPGGGQPCSLDSDCTGEDVCRSDESGQLTCGAPNEDTVQRVRITNFFASPSPIEVGGTSSLTWESENADACTITNSNDATAEDVAATGSLDVTPEVSTDYTLTCNNRDFEATQTASVVVNLAVAISSFEADAASIDRGASAELSWATENAVGCTLDSGEGEEGVDATGAMTVTPEETTTYTLRCTGFPEAVEESVEITVVGITNFTTTAPLVEAGESVTLEWDYNGTGSCALTIDGADVDITANTFELETDAGGTYVAEVTCDGVAGPLTSTLQVIAAAFETLVLTPNPVASGSTVLVTWTAVEVDSCTLRRVDGTPSDLLTGLVASGSADLENVTEQQDVQMQCARTLGETTVEVQSDVQTITLE